MLATRFVGRLRGLAGALALPPLLLCRPSLRCHVRRQLPPLGWITARHLPRRQPGRSPALDHAVLVDDLHARLGQRPHRRIRRAAHPCPPARMIFSHYARCAGLQPPDRDFSSMKIGFPRYKTSLSRTPALMTRLAYRATERVRRHRIGCGPPCASGSSHLSSRRAVLLLLPFLATPRHDGDLSRVPPVGVVGVVRLAENADSLRSWIL